MKKGKHYPSETEFKKGFPKLLLNTLAEFCIILGAFFTFRFVEQVFFIRGTDYLLDNLFYLGWGVVVFILMGILLKSIVKGEMK